jgi:molybdenum cofactor biosynthesis enzyme MoaA
MKSIEMYKLSSLYPNFTVILPGNCQSRCAFCSEPEGPMPSSEKDYQRNVQAVFETLPSIFRTISISGGEPTISGQLEFLMRTIRERQSLENPKHFHRVILTTNAVNLEKHLDTISGVVTNVNFSRHAADETDNKIVFTGNGKHKGPVVTKNKLKLLADQLHKRGIEVNLNCVYSDEHFMGRTLSKLTDMQVKQKTLEYIEMAKEIGVTSIVFRRDHHSKGELTTTRLERVFEEFSTISENKCESCRVISKIIGGMAVNFKQSRYEPIHYLKEKDTLYELILHSTGHLYLDWGRRHRISVPFPKKHEFIISQYAVPLLRPTLVDAECNVQIEHCTITRLKSPLNNLEA